MPDLRFIGREAFFGLVGLILIGRAALADVPTNGNLEQFSSGFPNNWTYDGVSNTDPSLENTQETSPFTNVYSKSTASIALNGTDAPPAEVLNTTFTPQTSSSVTVNFDFMYGSGTGTTESWDIAIQGPYINGQGNLDFEEFSLNNTTISNLKLQAGEWYNVQVTIVPNPAVSLATTTITPYGGGKQIVYTGPTESDYTASQPDSIQQLAVYNYDFADSGANNPTLYLDNFAVGSNIAPAPEPPLVTEFIIGLAVLLFFPLRVRSRR